MNTQKIDIEWKKNNSEPYVMRCDYDLKYKDETVLRFNPFRQTIEVKNRNLLPFSISQHDENIGMLSQFCSSRIMMLNRPYYKQLLLACRIDDQKPIPICITVSGLSFFDNYWICRSSHNKKWSDVNLFDNEFLPDISRTALTGDLDFELPIWDNIYTGELTIKGTRKKGVFREGDRILLFKNETTDEITSEICSSLIADIMGIAAAEYWMDRKLGLDCSVCEIKTSTDRELLPFRDIMMHYEETVPGINTESYKFMLKYGGRDFIMMQLFDYVMLNGDRNRDNYGLLIESGEITGLHPIFDHDSCFMHKDTSGTYFPLRSSFARSLEYLKSLYHNDSKIIDGLDESIEIIEDRKIKDIICELKSEEHYNGIVTRFHDLL